MARSVVEKAVDWARRKSPWIIHFNAGACNGCDIEVVDALTPRYDVERLGLIQRGSPRHADVLVCTGAVTLQTRDRLKRIYEQMPEPKFVLAVGTCACSGGIFDDCYCVSGGVDSVIPVSAYIPGCAARPEAILDAVAKLVGALEASGKSLDELTDEPSALQRLVWDTLEEAHDEDKGEREEAEHDD